MVISEYLILPPESTIWKKFPNLKPRLLMTSSDFRRHPDVLKGNSSADQLLKEFEEKMEIFLSFGNYIDFDLSSLLRFFSFYIGNKVKDEYFWFLIHKVFQVKCIDYAALVQFSEKQGLEKGTVAVKPERENIRRQSLIDRGLGGEDRSRRGGHPRPANRSPGNYSAYSGFTRQKMKKLNNDNTHNLRNQTKFLDAVKLLRENIFKAGLSFLLELKNQFQIYEKDASVLESRGAFAKNPDFRKGQNGGRC